MNNMKILLILGAILTVLGAWLVIDGRDGFKHAESKWHATKGVAVGFLMLLVGLATITTWYAMMS